MRLKKEKVIAIIEKEDTKDIGVIINPGIKGVRIMFGSDIDLDIFESMELKVTETKPVSDIETRIKDLEGRVKALEDKR